jgi:hypothetical protein
MSSKVGEVVTSRLKLLDTCGPFVLSSEVRKVVISRLNLIDACGPLVLSVVP